MRTGRDALDGLDRPPLHRRGRQQTCGHRLAIEQLSSRAADAATADEFGLVE
jgi:hypothetical protein